MFDTETEGRNLIESFHKEPDHPEKHYKCPICAKKMIKVYIGDEREILIDKCIKDHGFWFDKDELKTVIEFGSKEDNKLINLLKEMFENKISIKEKGENK
jgi:Zn-finger nucleic acid-binding protein